MRKFLLMLSVMTAWSVMVLADDYNYIAFAETNGTVHTFTAQGLEITFSGGAAVVKSGSEQTTLPLSSLASMKFTNDNTTTAIDAVEAEKGTPADVWTVSGVYVGRFENRAELQQLTHGVYVVKNNGKTQKIVLP